MFGYVIDLLLGVGGGILLIMFRQQIADFIKDTVGTSIIRDLGYPVVYAILGGLMILGTIASFVSNITSTYH